MLVYVINQYGQPLMPTDRCGRIRHLLDDGRARVIRRCPFTVQLLYESTNHTQRVSIGIDAGSKHMGLSATTETRVLYEAETELRTDIIKLLSQRREYRRSRRSRKTRYRKPRFLNRVRSKHKGWLAPSIEHKIQTHLRVIEDVRKFLPVSEMTVETASFDLQKLKADLEGLRRPEGADYQQGDQLGFWNAREYVLFRDGHECRCCHGKSKDPRLNVHHIESRQTGGDAPDNLVTLCETCHKGYHAGTVILPESIRRGMSFRDASFMGIMRWAFYNRLKETSDIPVHMTYGYVTKNTRIRHGLEKTHCVDARCISGNPLAVSDGTVYLQKKVRCHNRQIHKLTVQKGGYRKLNQAPYEVKGFRLFDKVLYEKTECFIFGRRTAGYFDVRKVDGTIVSRSASCKKIRLLERSRYYLTERRTAVHPTAKAVGFPA